MAKRSSVDLYTLCWNDKRMLPHFFRHYGPLVDRFFIFDNGSTDGSLETLAGDERVSLSHFETQSDSFVDTELQLSEEIWKNSKDSADWVFVLDMDEHVYHEDLPSYLRFCKERAVTAIRAIGYEMVSDTFPDASRRLCDSVTRGVRCPKLHDKLVLFDPSAITRTNFAPGRHTALPEGRVKWPSLPEVLLLHFKKLGLEYELFRSAELGARFGTRDIERDFGYHYRFSPDEITERFKRVGQLARPIPRTAREIWEEESVRLSNAIAAGEQENQRLWALAQQCDIEIARFGTQVAAANTEAARLRDGIVSRETQVRNLEAQTSALSADLSAARRAISATENTVTTVQETLTAAKDALTATQEAFSRTKEELQAVYQSRSWRVTPPIRSLRSHLARPLRLARSARESTPASFTPLQSDGPPLAQAAQITARSASGAPLAKPDCGSQNLALGRVATGTAPTSAKPLALFKHELESALHSDPTDWGLRREYFGVLEEISRRHFGCFHASLPEIATPLMIRASTSDIWNLRQIFLDGDREREPYMYGDYCFAMPRLQRILDLGAYCGYSAVYFANRFPEAEIVCVEPPGANFDALCANTSIYANIRRVAAAVWTERTTLHRSGQLLGDWGNYFAPADRGVDEPVPAYPISDILAMNGWDQVDFIKCLLVGAQVEVLTRPPRPWANRALLVATKPPKGVWPGPDDENRLLAAFPDALFEKIRNANAILAFRRRHDPSAVQPRARKALPLVPPSPGLHSVQLANIHNRFGFYKFDIAGLCLEPNPSGEPPASITWRLYLDNHNGFLARLASGPSPSASSRGIITLTIRDSISGAVRADEKLSVPPATEQSWTANFAPLSGEHDITLSAELSADAHDQQIPWIHIMDARFV